jgi:hypothetical protein
MHRWAKQATRCGRTPERMRGDLRNGRDLIKKRATGSDRLNMLWNDRESFMKPVK